MTGRLWVEGRFPSFNAGLALRGEEAVFLAQSRRGRELRAGFAALARAARAAARCAAMRACIPAVPPGCLACVWTYLAGHERCDPDAWMLAGKWCLDGLADAGVLRSDRRDVYATGGRVFGTVEEARAFFDARDTVRPWCGRPGALVEIAWGRA